MSFFHRNFIFYILFPSLNLHLECLFQMYTNRLKFCKKHEVLCDAEESKLLVSKQTLHLVQSFGYYPVVKSIYYIWRSTKDLNCSTKSSECSPRFFKLNLLGIPLVNKIMINRIDAAQDQGTPSSAD